MDTTGLPDPNNVDEVIEWLEAEMQAAALRLITEGANYHVTVGELTDEDRKSRRSRPMKVEVWPKPMGNA